EKTPKPKYVRKKADSDTSPKQKPVQATKGTRLKTKAKLATKRSKTQIHISQASDSGDGTDFESGVPNEPTSQDDWCRVRNGYSTSDKSDGNDDDDDGGSDDHDDDSNDERTESNRDEIPDSNLTNVEQTEQEEKEYNDEITKELYKEVNMNLGNDDNEMTNADKGGSGQQNVSQGSGFEQVEEDAHVALTTILQTHKTDEPVQSSSVSFDFISKLLNLENPSLADNEIASLMETSVPEITSCFTTTIPLPPMFNNRVTNIEKDLSEIKKVNQYAQAISSIPAIMDRYMDSKLEEPSHTLDDSGVQQDQEFDAGNNDEQPAEKEVSKEDWFKKSERPPTPDSDWNKRQHVDSRPSQTWINQVAHAKEPRTSFDELTDTSFDFSAFVLNRLNIKDLTQEILVGPAFELLKGTCKSLTELEYPLKESSKATTERLDWHNPKGKPYPFDLSKPLSLIRDHRGLTKTKVATYEIKWIEDLVHNLWSPVKDVYSRKRIISVTRLTIMKKYDYGHLEEIDVRRENQKLYKFREGDFPRLRLQDIEDMLLLLVQHKLTNLTIDERYALNVTLRMFTRWIAIQKWVEDLQLGVKSYQKKLNLTKPQTFSNGTLNDVRSALHDIAKGIRMEYPPKRKWSGLDKRRARGMIQDIDKQLYERSLMRKLEKFVGGREYEDDLSQNRRDLPRDIPLDSVEVLSAEGVEELKRNVKIKGEKKEALLTLRDYMYFYQLSHSELVGIEKVAVCSSLRSLKPKCTIESRAKRDHP
nr:hypothetical protein [Tanacetum cinerariifolium]